MSPFGKLAAAILLIGLAAFSMFGFLAAGEVQGSSQIMWRLSYGVLALGSVAGLFLVLRSGS